MARQSPLGLVCHAGRLVQLFSTHPLPDGTRLDALHLGWRQRTPDTGYHLDQQPPDNPRDVLCKLSPRSLAAGRAKQRDYHQPVMGLVVWPARGDLATFNTRLVSGWHDPGLNQLC